MKLVFLSRSFPPILGGMENQNFELLESLRSKADVVSILNKRGKVFLPLFLPYALFKLLIVGRSVDAVLLGDAATAPLGSLIKAIFRKPVFCIAHLWRSQAVTALRLRSYCSRCAALGRSFHRY